MESSDQSFKLSEQSFKKVLDREVFQPGATIFNEGQAARRAYIVLRGEVEISTRSASGGQITLTTVKKGQFFGELALMSESARTATATTRTGCEVMYIEQDKLKQKLDDSDPFIRYWIQYLSQRVMDLSKRVQS